MTTATLPTLTAGTWVIDTVHSTVGFSVRHLMVSKVRGTFDEFSGTITVAEDGTPAVEAEISVDSINTKNEQRDGHIKSADFFEVETHPEWTFVSTGIEADGADYKLNGDLTIKGVTKPVTLDLELGGFGPDAWGGTRCGFTATTTINRNDFGVDIALPLDGGGVVVSEKIAVTLDIQGVLRAA